MRQSLARKVAFVMCAVMLFCALPLNANVCAADAGKMAVSTAAGDDNGVTDGSETQQENGILEVLKKILEVVKKVAVALSDYLAEQEKAEQEQAKPEKDEKDEKDLSESGIAGYLYDPEEKCFYTASDPWQRTIGYNELFDVFSQTVLIDFDTVRFKFDYKKKNWVIQVWKGQYGLLFYGAEIGVYNKPANRKVPHYDAVKDDERLQMSMDFYEYKKSLFGKTSWKKQFSRPYDYYWWCTGFIPGNKDDEFDKLRVDARITAKDYDMLSGLKKAIEKEGITCQVNGLDVRFTYH